jgi:hypothetical protein
VLANPLRAPREIATFIFSLKEPLFNAVNRDKALSPAALAQTTWARNGDVARHGVSSLECPHYHRRSEVGDKVQSSEQKYADADHN